MRETSSEPIDFTRGELQVLKIGFDNVTPFHTDLVGVRPELVRAVQTIVVESLDSVVDLPDQDQIFRVPRSRVQRILPGLRVATSAAIDALCDQQPMQRQQNLPMAVGSNLQILEVPRPILDDCNVALELDHKLNNRL